MEEDEEYEDEYEYSKKIMIVNEMFKIIIILILLIIIYALRDMDDNDSNIDIKEINSKHFLESKNDNNVSIVNSINYNTTKNNFTKNIGDTIKISLINETKEIKNDLEKNNNNDLIKISEHKNISFSNKLYQQEFSSVVYFNITNINYTFSPKYNRTKLEYNIGIYDKNKKLFSPSDLSLCCNIKFLCFMKVPELNTTIYSIANNYENKYINCIEYFNYGENIIYGIKIYRDKTYLKIFFDSEKIINYTDLNHINDTLFDPDIIKQEYEKEIQEINKNEFNKSFYLKKEYIRTPIIDLRRNNITKDSNWTFNNYYNDYFCYCIGKNCSDGAVNKECKYLFYMTIIEKNKNLYPKTDYIFADFIFNYLSFDDTYPIFQEMKRQNYPVHYLTENKKIIEKYCSSIGDCESIIYVNIPKYINYHEAIEKYLTLILKTKAFITCRSTDYHKVGALLYSLDYITYITVGHGVCYFKDYLFSSKRIYGPDVNDKVLIPPSEPLIAIAVKFGWKRENIIKINLPKWDKYNETNKLIRDSYNNDIDDNSILIMFTYRMTRIAWNYNMSKYYFENITRLIFNENLTKVLNESNITLYFSLHRMVNPGYQKQYKQKLSQYKNVKVLKSSALSECLSKTNLVITDFSSILFDLMYRDKPFIIYLPDGDDPLINQLYTSDYIDLIKRMNNREFNISNICNTVEETVDKIIYYIKNKFQIDGELKKFFDYIGLKHEGSEIQKFIDYLTSL